MSATLAEVLHETSILLAQAGIDDAHLEAEVLLRHALGIDRARLYARLHDEMPSDAGERFGEAIRRRLTREPAAYITGHREFYGLDIECAPGVLIPRQETELLVEEALIWARARLQDGPIWAVDVGTGSGAIAVAFATESPASRVAAVDTSLAALSLAGRNARRHGVADRVDLVRGDLLTALRGRFDLILANLPYVRSGDWSGLQPEIREFEARGALVGGADGLDPLRGLLAQSRGVLARPGLLVAEIGEGQGEAASEAAQSAFGDARIEVKLDLAGLERLLVVENA